MLTIEHAPTHTSTPEKASTEQIGQLLTERDEIQEQLKISENVLDSLLSDEQIAKKIETIESEYDSDQDDSKESYFGYIIAHGEGRLPDDVLGAIKNKYNLCNLENEVLQKLDEIAGKELSDYAKSEAEKLIKRINYSVVGEISEKKLALTDSEGVTLPGGTKADLSPAVISDILYDIKLGNTMDEYELAERSIDTIESAKAVLQEWGALLPEDYQSEKAKDIDMEIIRAQELNVHYRNFHNEYGLGELASKSMLPIHEWGVDLSPREKQSLIDHLASLDKENEIKRIQIEGLEELSFRLTEKDIQDMFRMAPAVALEGINRIIFRSKDEEVKNKDANSKLWDGKAITMAHHDHSLQTNSAEIVVWTDGFNSNYQYYMENGYNSNYANEIATARLEETILHELGHALHNTLPVSLLQEWSTAARSENVDVSSYVEQMRIHEDPHYILEDFADSFASAKLNPRALKNKAPKRSQAMHSIVDPIS